MLGRMQLTLIPFAFTSSERDSTSLIIPLFEATYAASNPAPLSPGLAATWITLPLACFTICVTKCLLRRNAVLRLIFIISSHSFSSISVTGFPAMYPPMTFTKTSIFPKFFTRSDTRFFTSSSFLKSFLIVNTFFARSPSFELSRCNELSE
ncbi:Uncharacterised protein [uncultured archaeon]|nr:Uncharacterised protein [uncultured archaeon]